MVRLFMGYFVTKDVELRECDSGTNLCMLWLLIKEFGLKVVNVYQSKRLNKMKHVKEHHSDSDNNHTSHHAMMAQDFKKRFFTALVVSIPVLILSPTIQNWFNFSVPTFPGDKFLLLFLASVIALYTAFPFYTGALGELKEKRFGMMVLVSLAVGSGYLYSVATTFFIVAPDFYWEISTLVLVLLLGHWLEMRAVVGTSGALNELAKLIPPRANLVKDDDGVLEIETSQLAMGNIILIRPGEKVPIDGKVTDGSSSVNESLITGESKPVTKNQGDEVIGGSLNIDGSLKVKVAKIGKDTALSQIIELVKNAQESKPKTQKLADKAAHYLTLTAIIVGLLTFFSWNFLLGATFVFSLTLTITVIVITCPHALGLAIPTVTTITSTLAAKNGILIKDMAGLEKVKDTDYIVFDKTGTLTKGEFGVSDIVITSNDFDKEQILQTAASLEQHSEHVIARAITQEAQEQHIKLLEVHGFKAISGKGAVGEIKNAKVFVGTEKLLYENNIQISDEAKSNVHELEKQGKTVIYLATGTQVVGALALADSIKEDSKTAIQALKALGMKVAMLTGDNKQTAAHVAQQLGLDTYFAEVLPEDKVKSIEKLQENGAKVMMVGDGINDAPALTQADIGVAIGAGTDVAIASSEIVLIKNSPLDIVKIIKLSRSTMRKMKQNLAWATSYNLIAIPIAAGVLASWGIILRPEWGALAMTTSSIIVVINALLLKKVDLGIS